ncbi:hypothetical protein NE237_017339 [Protea cynaroides]|uniref:Uncharacterized protein n=1 Tax=Protea cynaroides TaxID=273540 RepID=A0A9Q0QMV7_9MAGN|nr:hypothetical protein NE237_017339 [Protea cynaroides]
MDKMLLQILPEAITKGPPAMGPPQYAAPPSSKRGEILRSRSQATYSYSTLLSQSIGDGGGGGQWDQKQGEEEQQHLSVPVTTTTHTYPQRRRKKGGELRQGRRREREIDSGVTDIPDSRVWDPL